MYHFFVKHDNVSADEIFLDGDDVNHIKNVLRMKQGEEISVSNGIDGKDYRCGIEEFLEKLKSRATQPNPKYKHIVQEYQNFKNKKESEGT